MAWYYMDGDQEIGPIEKEELQQHIKTKQLGKQTLVRNSTMKEWKPLADFISKKQKPKENPQPPSEEVSRTDSATEPPDPEPGNIDSGPSPETVVCSQCNRSFPKDRIVTFDGRPICAACKPAFVQKLKEGVTPAGNLRYAGFWIRFGAKIIDGILIYVVNMILVFSLGLFFGVSAMSLEPGETALSGGYLLMVGIQQLISIAIPTFYNTFFIGRFGATLGKMACGLKVVTPSGDRVSYPRALGRNFAEWISSLILSIGYIMAAFDDEKRALHDRMCNTRVIYKK